MLAPAARALSVSITWLRYKVEHSPTLQRAIQEERDGLKDVAELGLANLVADPTHPKHFDALKFYLMTQAQARGYGERSKLEVEQTITGSVEIVPAVAQIPDNGRGQLRLVSGGEGEE